MTRDRLTKLYVEITTDCNLDCTMCERRTWGDEPFGAMPPEMFQSLMKQVRAFPVPPVIHFGGYGEPTSHPQFLEFVRLAKETGAVVEMTTNGTLLTKKLAQALIELDMDRIVVSFDGVTPEVYADIRVHSSFKKVVSNFRELFRLKLRGKGRHSNPQVGIAFVAMKRNINDLPKLPTLATTIGAWDIQVSNVVPHYPEMEAEILYDNALTSNAFRESRWIPTMSLPKMDLNSGTADALGSVFDSRVSVSWLDSTFSAYNDYCKFVQEGYAVVRRDGEVSPCLSLLHNHPIYLYGRRKDVVSYSLGNIARQPLREIWESPEYTEFRQKLRDFPFSPCTTCGGCERFASNIEDCNHNDYPTCGGCLWAQGLVQCP